MKLSPEAQEVLDKAYAALRKAHVRNVHFEVRPRYCCGSSALVAQGICACEAVDEKEFRDRALSGLYGEEDKSRAEKLGLKGICFARWQKGKKVFRYDFITEETFEEPKALTAMEIRRVKMLRAFLKVFEGSPGEEADLKSLEERAEMHRQEIR